MRITNLESFKEFCKSIEADPLNLLWDISERNQKLLDKAIKELIKLDFGETETKVKKKLNSI